MEERTELKIWSIVSPEVISASHRLLLARSYLDRFESNSFLFCLGKSGTAAVDSLQFNLNGNLLLQVPADKTVIIDAGEGEAEIFCVTYRVEFPPKTGSGLYAAILRDDPFKKCRGVRVSDPALFTSCFTRLAESAGDKSALAAIGRKADFYGILKAFFTELNGEGRIQKPDSTEYVRQYLQQHYGEKISLQKLAETLQISRSTLTENFRKRLGTDPSGYLKQLRLSRAAAALAESGLTLEEIAVTCGLRDKSYFSRVFRKEYGMSPGAYRKANAGNVKGGRRLYSRPEAAGEDSRAVRIENMGRVHRYYGVPGRIVCLDYAAAEICAALGLSDRMTGVASSEESLLDCRQEYRSMLGKIPLLPGRSQELNVPGLDEVCACRPDLVIGTGYSFATYGGVAEPEAFESRGIHIYALTATFTPGSGFDSVYTDIRNIGAIFARQAQAETLINGMRQEEAVLEKLRENTGEALRVFVFDGFLQDKAFTCGQTLENHMITAAGGVNVFGGRKGLFFPVSFEEAAEADPQVIIVHAFHSAEDGRQKISLLKQIPEIAQTEAVKYNRFLTVGIKKIFPGIDAVETALEFARFFRQIREK